MVSPCTLQYMNGKLSQVKCLLPLSVYISVFDKLCVQKSTVFWLFLPFRLAARIRRPVLIVHVSQQTPIQFCSLTWTVFVESTGFKLNSNKTYGFLNLCCVVPTGHFNAKVL